MSIMQDAVSSFVRSHGTKGILRHIERVNTYGKVVTSEVTSEAYVVRQAVNVGKAPDGVKDGDIKLLIAAPSDLSFELQVDDIVDVGGTKYRVVNTGKIYHGDNDMILTLYVRV